MSGLTRIFSAMTALSCGIRAKRRSSHLRFGDHPSVFVGEGHDFHQLKDYDPSQDSPHRIAWYHSTEPDEIKVLEFVEPKEEIVILALDLSSSMVFGVEEPKKLCLMLEIAGTLGLTASRFQDRVGFVGFTDRIVMKEPPRLGSDYVYYFIGRAYEFLNPKGKFSGRKTNLYVLLDYLEKSLASSSLVFVISDFIGWEKIASTPIIRSLTSRHELIFIIVDDEQEFSTDGINRGIVRIKDMEEGRVVDISLRNLGKIRKEILADREEMIRKLNKVGVDSLVLTYGNHISKLESFLEGRRSQ